MRKCFARRCVLLTLAEVRRDGFCYLSIHLRYPMSLRGETASPCSPQCGVLGKDVHRDVGEEAMGCRSLASLKQ